METDRTSGGADSVVPLVRRGSFDFEDFESEDEAIEWGVSPSVVAHTGACTYNPHRAHRECSEIPVLHGF